jgi:excisionase family DNA binding protein
MKKQGYITIGQLSNILGISRIAVYKKVKKGQIKAERIGRIYAIPREYVDGLLGTALREEDKVEINKAVRKTVREYGEVLRLLGDA